MNTCFLFVEQKTAETCLSLVLNKNGQIEAPLVQRTFEEIRALQETNSLYVVASATHFTFHKLELPWLNERKARAAIPFALEEQLAQNVEELHFAYDNKYYHNGHYTVVTADKNYLYHLISDLDAERIDFDCITLDWFALREHEIALLEKSFLIHEESFCGAITIDLLSVYLKSAKPLPTVYSFTDSEQSYRSHNGLHFEDMPISAYVWVAERLQHSKPLNLCQGELKHGKKDTLSKWLNWTALTTTVLWVLSWIVFHSLEIHSLNKELDKVDDNIAVIYREFFPQSQKIISPKFRIAQLLKSGQNATDSSLWQLLDKLSRTYTENSLSIEQMRLQNNHLLVTVVAKSFEQLEEFQAKLQKEQVLVKQTQAHTKDNQVVSTLELSL